MDTQRALNFLTCARNAPAGGPAGAGQREILRDIEISAAAQRIALFQKVNFLMQAAMGFTQYRAETRIVRDLLGGLGGIPAANSGGLQLRDEL